MIGDDERREVAKRPRNFERLRGVFRESNVCACWVSAMWTGSISAHVSLT